MFSISFDDVLDSYELFPSKILHEFYILSEAKNILILYSVQN